MNHAMIWASKGGSKYFRLRVHLSEKLSLTPLIWFSTTQVRSLSRRCGAFINNEFNTSLTASEFDLSPPSPSSGATGNSSRRISATFKGTVPLPPKIMPTEPVAGTWFYVSDTHVVEVTEAKVLKAQAYLLFYERIY